MLHNPFLNTILQLDDKASIVCEMGKKLVITTEDSPTPQSKKPRPSWTAIGNGMQTRHFKSYPYEETLLKLTANEARMFGLILQCYNTNTGYAVLDMSTFTHAEKNKLSLGYKALKQRELVKRTKPCTYLINPTAKIHLSLFSELFEVWNTTP